MYCIRFKHKSYKVVLGMHMQPGAKVNSEPMYRILKNFDWGNINGLALFRSLTRKILTDSPLDNLSLLYN